MKLLLPILPFLVPSQAYYLPKQRLAIKEPHMEAHDERSLQSLLIKRMQERFALLHDEISPEASYCLVGVKQNTASSEKLREFLDDAACLIQRNKGKEKDFYLHLHEQYAKDAQRFERLFHQADFLEVRPENLGLLLRKYAQKNSIDINNFVAIGDFAKKDESLSLTEKKGMRDVVNFMKNPISRKTFEHYCESRSALERIEFTCYQIKILQDLLCRAQQELNCSLLEQNDSIMYIES